MILIYVIFAVLILLGLTAGTILYAIQRCTHEEFPQLHAETGRIFWTCWCGDKFRVERFQR